MTSTEASVLLLIASYANEEGLAWPTQATLASASGLSVRGLRNVVAKLQARLLFDIEPARWHRSARYRFRRADLEALPRVTSRARDDVESATVRSAERGSREEAGSPLVPSEGGTAFPSDIHQTGTRFRPGAGHESSERNPEAPQTGTARPSEGNATTARGEPRSPDLQDHQDPQRNPARAHAHTRVRGEGPPRDVTSPASHELMAARPKNATADGCFGAAVSAWAEGIKSVTGKTFVPPLGGSTELAKLVNGIVAHCPEIAKREMWAREQGKRFAETSKRELSAHSFLDWLNSPSTPAGGGAQTPVVDRVGREERRRADEAAQREGLVPASAMAGQLMAALDKKRVIAS